MKEFLIKSDKKLDFELTEAGDNISVGQKQLICLARALLNKNKIIIMDEATASIDNRTDQLIQKTIINHFRDCTVITIAHRLETIMDSDRILILENGKIAEFDTPHNLLLNKNNLLYSYLYGQNI